VAIVVTKKSELATFINATAEKTSAVVPPAKVEAPAPAKVEQTLGKAYPKHSKLGLPALSPTMEKGNLMSWTK
jgi:pyruvate dehydrogenase E2 component (dihydrolipoamide acetyltransferase)